MSLSGSVLVWAPTDGGHQLSATLMNLIVNKLFACDFFFDGNQVFGSSASQDEEDRMEYGQSESQLQEY